ncbi:hypothetical protein RHGRI_028070 [Rhododendron griersonianum]|uniref:Uncharacterized protein n=1 Tax=Rhododendron griersonianum TaxID=479676 RepID=A0AAV6IJ14_9ERIC|nr:hypothetical protein RHGRI_028070 [Rhododendron griersonianum]
MVVHVPFSCWVHVGNASYLSSRAALFIWKLPEVRRNHMTYEPFDFFLGDYYEIFLLGTVVEWNFSCQLGAGHCWYLKYVPPANHAERRTARERGKSSWVISSFSVLASACRFSGGALAMCLALNLWLVR